VFFAMLVCSDGDCAATYEAYGSFEELEGAACECGCCLETLAFGEVTAVSVNGAAPTEHELELVLEPTG
jgi:hypothetical protein